MSLENLDNVGRYEVVRPIGKGGFSTVFLGRDPYINRSLALKVTEMGDASKQRTTLSKLFKEAEAAGSLIHPNIVTIFDAGIAEPICFIAMEYIDGSTLYKHCHPGDLLAVADALDVMIKVCHGLDFAHQRGIIHRDIKPSNILLGTRGEIKIADFGLACFAELAVQSAATVGTPSYMPPEQVEGKAATPQSDLFSVGVILYQLLCGVKPFDAQGSLEMRRKILKEPHKPLKEQNSELPPELYDITDRALSKDPDLRFQSGFEFARALESVMKGSHKSLEGKLAERIRELKTLKFFEDFSDLEVADLLTIGTWLTHEKGSTIIREEEAGGAFYVLSAGQATVDIGKKEVSRLGRGDSFGEMSFLLGSKRTATIKAIDECHLLKLDPSKIDILPQPAQVKLYRLFAKTLAGCLLRK